MESNNEWITYKIEDLGEVVGGGTPSTKKSEYFNGEIPWITPKDLSNFTGTYLSRGERNISKQGLQNSSAKLLPKDTVLLSSRAPIGYLAISANKLTTNQGFKSIICNKDIVLPFYLFYSLKNDIERIKALGTGSTFSELSGKAVKQIELRIPSINTQKKVVDILKNIDYKIEINRNTIANLEELSETLFKRWFIDFEFPDENGNPYKSSGGKMKNIGKEDIPINWNKGYLSKYIEGTRSGDWGKETSQGNYVSEVTIIRGADIPPLKTGDLGNPPRRFILEKNTQSKKLSVGDIIVEISGGSPTQSTGRTLYINKKLLEKFNTPVLCTNFCRILRPKNIDFGIWIEFYFSYLYKSDLFFNFENGTTGIKNFDYNSLINKFEIFTPDDSTIFAFSNLVNQIYKTIQSYGDENIKLSKLRDTLLPKLMSGDIELPDELEVDEHAELLQ